MSFAILSRAKLQRAILRDAVLKGTSLRRAILRGADLTGANLRHASLAEADVTGALFARNEVYGVGVWQLKGKPKSQSGLIIQPDLDTPPITVNDLDTAQLIFLLLENPKIASIIEAASNQTVLLLGRFTDPRKRVLNAIKVRLLARNFVPLLFDFAKPLARDLTETVASLAHLACFVIADLTGAKSVAQELSYIVPYLPSVPVVPLIGPGERQYSMFEHFARYPWVLPVVRYRSVDHLLRIFDARILEVAHSRAMASRDLVNSLKRARTRPPK